MNKDKWIADLGNGMYRNPILYTDYSDPDAIRVNDDYFMIASSFSNAPAIPILHSKDLVNWKVINYVMDSIPEARYEKPVHGCGVWAPAIRYHEGTYYVCFPMPDEGIYMSTTKDPFGKWSTPINIRPGAGWIDPCPFWDEDGNAYLVAGVAKSRIGYKSVLHLVRMKPDGTGIFGDEVVIFDGNQNDQETIEGPKLYKRNGYYYVFAPAGGVKTGWQTILRSKNIWGPYEYKVVLRQGNTQVNGPHQGAWVDTVTGEDWFLHFQDVYAAGRITHLQPMQWVNDWPIIGKVSEGCEYGEPVMEYRKPNVGQENNLAKEESQDVNMNSIHEQNYVMAAPCTSDEFQENKLGLQWQWNANPKNDWYHMDTKRQVLCLHAVPSIDVKELSELPNLLLQKWPAPKFCCDTKINLTNLLEDDCAGIVSMGVTFGGILFKRCSESFVIQAVEGMQEFHGEKANSKQSTRECGTLTQNQVYLRYEVKCVGIRENVETKNAPQEEICMSYSIDGIHYEKIVTMLAQAGRWVGVKLGLVCYTDCEKSGGAVEVEYVRFDQLK